MKTFMQYITEDGIEIGPMLRRMVSPRARKPKEKKVKWDSRESKKVVDWQKAEEKLKRDMDWTTNTNAAT